MKNIWKIRKLSKAYWHGRCNKTATVHIT